MTQYSTEPKDLIFLKVYEFLSFAKNTRKKLKS